MQGHWVRGTGSGACGVRTQGRFSMESIGDAIVLKGKQIDSTLGIAKSTQESSAAGFGGRAAAASILAPM